MASANQGPQIRAPESFDQPTHIPFAQTTRIILGRRDLIQIAYDN